jgi:hypothetical protein
VMPPGLIVPELMMSPLNEVSLKVHEARVWPAELMKLAIAASRRRHPPPGLTPSVRCTAAPGVLRIDDFKPRQITK